MDWQAGATQRTLHFRKGTEAHAQVGDRHGARNGADLGNIDQLEAFSVKLVIGVLDHDAVAEEFCCTGVCMRNQRFFFRSLQLECFAQECSDLTLDFFGTHEQEMRLFLRLETPWKRERSLLVALSKGVVPSQPLTLNINHSSIKTSPVHGPDQLKYGCVMVLSFTIRPKYLSLEDI